MRKFRLFLVLFVINAFLILPAFADQDVSVTATVTPEQISVALYGGSPSSVNYGTVAYGSTDQSPINDPYVDLVNNGTVRENFNVRGDDATALGGSTWQLDVSSGHDRYIHKFGRGQSPTEYFHLTKSPADNMIHGEAGVAVNSREGFKLKLSMPTSASVQTNSPYTTTVTVVASSYY